MRKGQATLAATLILIVAALLLLPTLRSPTGAAVVERTAPAPNLSTQLIIRPMPMSDIETAEDTPATVVISDYFKDWEGDPIFYYNSPRNIPNITFSYAYSAPSSTFTNDSQTLLLCHMNGTQCQGTPSAPVMSLNGATINTSIDSVPGKFGRGLYVEDSVNLMPDPGFEGGAVDSTVPGWTNPHEGLATNFTVIGNGIDGQSARLHLNPYNQHFGAAYFSATGLTDPLFWPGNVNNGELHHIAWFGSNMTSGTDIIIDTAATGGPWRDFVGIKATIIDGSVTPDWYVDYSDSCTDPWTPTGDWLGDPAEPGAHAFSESGTFTWPWSSATDRHRCWRLRSIVPACPDPCGNFVELQFLDNHPLKANITRDLTGILQTSTTYTLSVYGNETSTALDGQLALRIGDTLLCTIPLGTTLARRNATCTTPDTFAGTPSLELSSTTTQDGESPIGDVVIDDIQLEKSATASPYAGSGPDQPTVGPITIDTRNATIDFWMKPMWNGTDTTQRMFLDASSPSNKILIGKGICGHPSDYIVFSDYPGSCTNHAAYNISNWMAGTWHHIRLAISNQYGGAWLFVDGVLGNRSQWNGAGPDPSTITIGATSGGGSQADAIFDDVRVYNRALPLPGPVNVTVIPRHLYNTQGTTGVAVVFNASDPSDGEYNIQNPVFIKIASVDNPPGPPNTTGPGLGPNGEYPPGCDPDAPPLSPSRCVFYNNSFLDRDVLENTNYAYNLSAIIADPDDQWSALTFNIVGSRGEPIVVDFNDTKTNGNVSFIPPPFYSGHELYTYHITDPSGREYVSNEFLLNFLPVSELNHIAWSGGTDTAPTTLTWQGNAVANFSLAPYINNPDGDAIYGFENLADTGFTIIIDPASGNATITPPQDQFGQTLVDFTAYDPAYGITLSHTITLNVTRVPIAANLTTPIPDVYVREDNLTTLNISDYFEWPQGAAITIRPIYPDLLMFCTFDSTTCEKGGAPNQSIDVGQASGVIVDGIYIANDSTLQYNTTGIDPTNGTIEFWYIPAQNASMNVSNMTVNQSVVFQLNGAGNSSIALTVLHDFNATLLATMHSATDLVYNISVPIGSIEGTPQHVAMTWSSTPPLFALYLNGTLVGSDPLASGYPAMTNLSALYIGSNTTGQEQAVGTYDEMRIWDYATSADQVHEDYTYAFPFVGLHQDETWLNFTPSADYFGNFSMQLNISENVRDTDNLSNVFHVIVTPVNDPPVFKKNMSDKSWDEDTTLSDAFNLYDYFSDIDNQTLIFNATGQDSINITIGADGSVNLSQPPNWFGSETFHFNVSDGEYSVISNDIVLTVRPTPDVLAVLTPDSPANGTVPIYFYITDSVLGYVNANATYSIDGGNTFQPAHGNSLLHQNVTNISEHFDATDDSRLAQSLAGTNYGNDTLLFVGTDANKAYRSALRFRLPRASASMITSAKLRLFQTAAFGEGRSIDVYTLNDSWTEGGITWTNAPGTNGSAPVDTRYVDAVSEYKEWDVTDAVRAWVNGNTTNNGFLLRGASEPNSLGLHEFASSEYSGNVTPQLIIDYQGTPHVFDWNSIADINFTNQDLVVVQVTVYPNVSQMTYNFSVWNNHPPLVRPTAVLNYTFYDNGSVIIDGPKNIFYDIDNQSLFINSSYNSSELNVTAENDVQSAGVMIADNVGFQGVPDATITGTMDRFVVWEQPAGGVFHVNYARYDPSAHLVRSGGVLTSVHDQKQPRVSSGDNYTAIVWREDAVGSGIRLALLGPTDTMMFHTDVTNTSVRHTQPSVAVNGDNITVAWVDLSSGTGQLHIAAYARNGTQLLNDTQLTFAPSSNVTQPVVAAGPGSNLTLAWLSNGLVMVAFLNASWNVTAGPMQVSENISTYKADPSIFVHGGDSYLTWADDRNIANTSTLMLALYSGTTKQSESAIIDDTIQRFTPSLVLDSFQNRYVAYSRGVERQSDIGYLKTLPNGSIIFDNSLTNDNLQQTVPTLVIDPLDRKFVVWQHHDVNDQVRALGLSGPTGRLIVSAALNYSGNASMNMSAFDGWNTTYMQVNFSILFVNDAPLMANFTLQMQENSVNNTFNLTPYGWDEETPAEYLSWNATAPKNWTIIMLTNTPLVNLSNISITPPTNYNGNMSIRFRLSDGNSIVRLNQTIEVLDVPAPPLLDRPIPNQSWAVDTSLILNLSSYLIPYDNDSDALVFINDAPATNITFTFLDDGTVNMTPAPGWRGRTSVVFNASDGPNTTQSNTVVLSVVRMSFLNDSRVDGTLYNGNYTNITGLDGANLTLATADGSLVTDSAVYLSTLLSSNLTQGMVNSSTINNSALTNCTIIRSTVKNYKATDCVQTDSSLDPDSTYDATGSTVTNSGVMYTDVTYSNITNSTLLWDTVDHSTVLNSSFEETQTEDAVITNGYLRSGTLTFNGNTYDADANGEMILVNITNYRPIARFTYRSDNSRNVTFNASTSSDPNIPVGTGAPLHDFLTYKWTFGDGNASSTDPVIAHEYVAEGSYAVTLMVVDSYGKNSSASVSLTMGHQPSNGGGGGGGGGGEVPRSDTCVPTANCGPWSDCVNGQKTRICPVYNDCGNASLQPRIQDICIPNIPLPTCTDGIKNQGENGIDCGGPCNACPQQPETQQPATPPAEPTPIPTPTPITPTPTPSTDAGVAAVLVGLALVLVTGALMATRSEHKDVAEATGYALKAMSMGQSEAETRKRLLANNWHKGTVEKALRNVSVTAAAAYVRKRVADGTSARTAQAELMASGWSASDAKKVVKKAASKLK